MAIVRSFLFISLTLGILVPATTSAQFGKVFSLDENLEEVSGMVTDGRYVWMINDSGNDAELYEYEGSNFLGVYTLEAENIDWEAMAMDRMGNIYIGDIGNNNNNRNERSLYIIKKGDLNHQYGQITPEVISFEIARELPPPENNRDYDWESLIYHNGHFYTFSKNRREPFDGMCLLIDLGNLRDSTFNPTIVDSTDLGGLIRFNSWITDATLSADRRHLFLLSSDKVIAFLDFPESSFFEGYRVEFPLHHLSQKEGITAYNDSIMLITDEHTRNHGGRNMYTLNVQRELYAYELSRKYEVKLDNKQFDTTLTFTVNPIVRARLTYELLGENGTPVKSGILGEVQAGKEEQFSINTSELNVGRYILNVRIGRHPHGFFIAKPYNAATQGPLNQEEGQTEGN